MAFLRRVRLGLMIVGGVLTVVGVLGLLLDWGANPAKATKPRTTAATSTQPSSSTVSEDPITFFSSFQAAIRGGDVAFLAARIHPAVTARYGAAQCQTFLPNMKDPSVALQVSNVTGPQAYDYASDGQSTSVPDTFFFQVDGTAAGTTGPRTYHFGLVDGQFRIFIDCGTPVSGG